MACLLFLLAGCGGGATGGAAAASSQTSVAWDLAKGGDTRKLGELLRTQPELITAQDDNKRTLLH